MAAKLPARVKEAVAMLDAASTAKDRANLDRFGIHAKNSLGVSMSNIQKIAKQLGRDHDLAAALWDTGVYEARMLTAFVDEPERVTGAQMDRWCRDFDNWGICDTLCFCLFDRTAHAWAKVAKWCPQRAEFVKRGGFALLASLAGHDKTSGDEPFLNGLKLIEAGAADDRNFVKKGVSWALRRIATRNPKLRKAATEVATRLAESDDPGARWVGKDALREFSKRKKA